MNKKSKTIEQKIKEVQHNIHNLSRYSQQVNTAILEVKNAIDNIQLESVKAIDKVIAK